MKHLLSFILFLLFLSACVVGNRSPIPNEEETYDLPQMKDSGELVALTLYSSTSYFLYRGEPCLLYTSDAADE